MAKKKKIVDNVPTHFNEGQTIQFYPDFVGPRTFFFESLRENENPEAQRILKIGENMININQLDGSLNEEEFLKTTLEAMEFLKRAAQDTLKNERRIFEEKIVPLCKGTEYEQQCNECFKNNNVDYINFLALINKLTNKSKEAMTLLNDLYDSMKNYNDLANTIITTDDYAQIKTNYGNISTQVKNKAEQEAKKIVSDKAKIFANQLKIYQNQLDNNNDNINTLKNFLSTHVSELFSNSTKKYQMRSTNIYMTELISSALEFILAYQDLLKIATNQNTYQIDQFIQPFINLIENDQELKENFINEMNKKIEQLDKQEQLMQQKNKQLEKILNDIINDKIKINDLNKYTSGLTIDIRKYLAQLYPELAGENNEFITGYINERINGQLTEKKILKFNINKREDREKYFKTLREVFQNKNKETTDLQIIKQINDILKRKEKRTEIITVASEYDSARFKQLLTSSIFNLTGSQNLRKDLTGYTVATLTLQNNDFTKKDVQTLIEILQQAVNQIDSQYGTTYELEIKRESEIKDKNGTIIKKGRKGKNYRLGASLKAQEINENRLIKNINQELKDKTILAIEVKDIFQIDDSVKYHETYIDKTGFTGGSLGANIEEQITNINKMLELGGITPIEKDFLITAVLNAGPALIGSHQRSALENYFSTVASMLMFRSGGQALQNLSLEGLNYINNDTTKIHIYTFNTLFFPESYVLQKTYEGLSQCTNLLTTSASNYGSRASIYNPISDKDIIYDFQGEGGENSRGKKMSAIRIPNWEKTAENNYKTVSIDMVLMGGFLDVMEKMLSVMNNTFK